MDTPQYNCNKDAKDLCGFPRNLKLALRYKTHYFFKFLLERYPKLVHRTFLKGIANNLGQAANSKKN